jgi:hypothetical protein
MLVKKLFFPVVKNMAPIGFRASRPRVELSACEFQSCTGCTATGGAGATSHIGGARIEDRGGGGGGSPTPNGPVYRLRLLRPPGSPVSRLQGVVASNGVSPFALATGLAPQSTEQPLLRSVKPFRGPCGPRVYALNMIFTLHQPKPRTQALNNTQHVLNEQ